MESRSMPFKCEKEDEKPMVCRVCIRIVDREFYNIFEKYEGLLAPDPSIGDMLIACKLRACANVIISRRDGLPHVICASCLLELENAYNFKKKCENSDELLRSQTLNTSGHLVLSKFDTSVDNEKVEENSLNYATSENQKLLSPKTELFSSYNESEEIEINENDLGNVYDQQNTNETELIKEEKSSSPTDFIHNKMTENLLSLKKDITEFTEPRYSELECDYCGNLFRSKSEIQIHIQKEHYTSTSHYVEPSLDCNKSTAKWKNASNYSHKSDFTCKQCTYKTKWKKYLRLHEKRHMISDYVCGSCGKLHYTESELTKHSKTHGIKPHVCSECNRSYTKRNTLTWHLGKAHNIYLKAKGTKKIYERRDRQTD